MKLWTLKETHKIQIMMLTMFCIKVRDQKSKDNKSIRNFHNHQRIGYLNLKQPINKYNKLNSSSSNSKNLKNPNIKTKSYTKLMQVET